MFLLLNYLHILPYLYCIRDGKTISDEIEYDIQNHELELLSYNNSYDEITFTSSLSYLGTLTNKSPKYCYAEYDNKEVIELCSKLKLHTIKPTIIIKKDPYKELKNNLSNASSKIRSFGSIIGGYFGMVVILIAEYILIDVMSLNTTNYPLYLLITYVIVSVGIIPLIVIAIVFKQQTCVFISCLTYLSVTISIRNGGMNVILFATNRVLSTLIGIGISLLVNNISLFIFKVNEIRNSCAILCVNSRNHPLPIDIVFCF